MLRLPLISICALALALGAGCRVAPTADEDVDAEREEVPLPPPRGLTLALKLAPVVAPGQEVVLEYRGQGRSLRRLTVHFGDDRPGVTVAAEGQESLRGEIRHTYTRAGQFTVVAVLSDLVGRSVRETLVIRVVP